MSSVNLKDYLMNVHSVGSGFILETWPVMFPKTQSSLLSVLDSIL